MSAIKRFFTPRPPRYYTPERLKEEIVVYLSAASPPPERVPAELQPHIPKIIWDERLAAIEKRASQYYYPVAMRIYFMVAILAVFIVPIGLYQIISHSMIPDAQKLRAEESAKYFFEAKAIAFAIFLGTILVFFGPIWAWGWLAQRHMNALIAAFAAEDQRKSTTGAPPAWKCTAPGLFRPAARVGVALPPARSGSAFGLYAFTPAHHRTQSDAFSTHAREKGTHESLVGDMRLFSPARSTFTVIDIKV